jgi:hypothetical protein
VKLSDALLNAAETQSVARTSGIESDPVITDRNPEFIIASDHSDGNRLRVGVPDAIGQRFLNRPVHARSMAIGKAVEFSFYRQFDVRTVTTREVAYVPFERGLETEVVQHTRSKAEREIAYRPKHAVNELLALGHRGTGVAIGKRLRPLDSPKLHP